MATRYDNGLGDATAPPRVFTLGPLPPERLAYALARYSRSPDSIQESLKWVRTHDSSKFLESFYFQYGHASIADLGHLAVCFEGISELAAIEIEDEALWDGQARSSRYQDFSLAGYVTPPELDEKQAALYRATGEGLLAAYRAVHEKVFGYLHEKLPRPEQMKPGAYERNLAARAFDVARYLLFLGVPTGVGQVTSIRTLERQIRRWKGSEYGELRGIGEETAAACAAPPGVGWEEGEGGEAIAPTLAKYVDRDPYPELAKADLQLWAEQNLPAASLSDVRAVELVKVTDTLADIVATLTVRTGVRVAADEAAGSGRGGAGATNAARRTAARVSRRAVRLRHDDRYRRVPRPAPASPLPAVPAGVHVDSRVGDAGGGGRSGRG